MTSSREPTSKVVVPPSVGDYEIVVRVLERDGTTAIEVWDYSESRWVPGGPEDIRPVFFGGLRRLSVEELEQRGIVH